VILNVLDFKSESLVPLPQSIERDSQLRLLVVFASLAATTVPVAAVAAASEVPSWLLGKSITAEWSDVRDTVWPNGQIRPVLGEHPPTTGLQPPLAT
jgi:hypothetical protein